MKATHRKRNKMLKGIRASLIRRKIRQCHRQLGNGHDVKLHLTLAGLYEYMGDQTRAIEAYRQAARSVITYAPTLDTSASDQLIAIYKRVLTLAPEDHDIAHRLGQEYRRRGMEYRAISLHTQLAERDKAQGDYRSAITHYQEVCEIEPGSISVRDACARLYRQMQEYEQGAQEYAAIGDVYFQHRKFDGALEYYQQAADLLPDNKDVQEKVKKTRRMLEGTFAVQASEHEQIERLLHQHHRLIADVEQEKRLIEQQYQAAQNRLYAVEEEEMDVIVQLEGELSRQFQMESGFSNQFRESLGEMTHLLSCQEQEIHQLEQLQP